MFQFHFSSECVQSVGKEFWRVHTRCNSIWRSSFCCSNPRRTWAIQALVHLQTRPTLQSWALSFPQKTDKNKDSPLNFNTNFVIAEATLVKTQAKQTATSKHRVKEFYIPELHQIHFLCLPGRPSPNLPAVQQGTCQQLVLRRSN